MTHTISYLELLAFLLLIITLPLNVYALWLAWGDRKRLRRRPDYIQDGARGLLADSIIGQEERKVGAECLYLIAVIAAMTIPSRPDPDTRWVGIIILLAILYDIGTLFADTVLRLRQRVRILDAIEEEDQRRKALRQQALVNNQEHTTDTRTPTERV